MIEKEKVSFKNISQGDFPGGPVVNNPPSNTGNSGLISSQETKIPTYCGAAKPQPKKTREPQGGPSAAKKAFFFPLKK